jgi:hypothetical protein
MIVKINDKLAKGYISKTAEKKPEEKKESKLVNRVPDIKKKPRHFSG